MNSLAKRGRAPYALGRASQAPSGFSLVELLVTVVLAGIVFAALVPVFVSAQKASSGDRSRNIATNVAQDRIEKIRLLAFDQIVDDASHLRSSSFAGGQFGSTYTPAGSTKEYSVAYSVENVPSTGAVNYKRVSVTVSWTAPPAPVQPVTMTTIVMNPTATSASSSPSPSPSASASPSPSPSPTLGTYSLTILVTNRLREPVAGRDRGAHGRHAQRRGDAVPAGADDDDSGRLDRPLARDLPRHLQLLQSGNKTNKKQTLTQTVYVTTTNQTYTFTL